MKNLAIFASGKGSNTISILDYFERSSLARIVLIISNKPDAGVLGIAAQKNINHFFIEKAQFDSNKFLSLLKEHNIFLIVLAGFLLKVNLSLIKLYPNRIINIHPSLLPKYGGKGMYGHFVHQAVIENKEKESGITIHFVNENYDEGNIIFQKKITLNLGETTHSLCKRINVLEHECYPKVIEKLVLNNE